MRMCMYVCMYVYVCAMRVCMYICMYMHIRMCMCIFMCICMRMHICMCICICVCICAQVMVRHTKEEIMAIPKPRWEIVRLQFSESEAEAYNTILS